MIRGAVIVPIVPYAPLFARSLIHQEYSMLLHAQATSWERRILLQQKSLMIPSLISTSRVPTLR